jgi:hypothetical protein
MFRTALALATLLVASAPAFSEGEAGAVSQTKGSATGSIDGAKHPLDVGTSVFMNEVLATAAAARLEVTLLDTTKLTLGENAELRIDSFVYSGKRTQSLKFAAVGALRMISSRNKPPGAPGGLRTPVVEIGIRGTDFWTGPIDGQFGVLLLEGAVSVSNAAGAVVLDQPGEGTNIAGPGSAPGPVTQWPQQKVDRALAEVAF